MGETPHSGGCLCGATRYEEGKLSRMRRHDGLARIDIGDPADRNALFETMLRHASP